MENCQHHTAIEQALSRDERRLNSHADQLRVLSDCAARLTVLQEEMDKRVSDHGQRITHLESRPAKRWESVVGYVLMAAIGAVVTYIAINIGL